jgi:hypothetical protein
VGVGVGVGVGVAFFTATPLFQINFFPDLTQVYFLPAAVLICPTFLHASPALTAALEIEGLIAKAKEAINAMTRARFMFLA